ncbi:MAG: hypothetical protein EAZ47_04920 [Bacteroidetes bacterium]|nr:MAG: hypothetical protein EAY72_01810 [Bacteroidota bacterium]TAE72893.1 MAG: hypothetical protein EAY68_00155 [Bacteroidota bacterium]TAF94034.1 MAG: hypothetical protein EAZ47_04920 [Bacteroidota bacterium]
MAAIKDFSVEEKLVSLIKIQKIDSKLDEFQQLKGELPMEVNDLEDEILGLNSRRTHIEQVINGMTAYIDDRKKAIVEAQELVKKYEKQSESVKNSREFEAITKEIENEQLNGQLAEKKIKETNEELAEKVKALETVKKQIATKEGVLAHKKGELDKIIADTEKEETKLRKVAEQARAGVDERLIYAYDRIRGNYRNGLAVVPVERNACGGCFNSIPPQKQSEIKNRKKTIVCENCGRILVDDDLNNSVEI